MGADPVLVATRRALHGVAELVLAGPQYAATGTIKLRVVEGGIGTTRAPDLRIVGSALIAAGGKHPLDGRTARDVAGAAGMEVHPLDDVYHDGSGVGPDDVLVVDDAAAGLVLGALAAGDAALRAFAPSGGHVLWPEHFDIGISEGEVNYGVSPGDDHIPVPYAYVGPWTVPPADDFWTEPFGAARPISALVDAAGIREFFEQGREASQHA